MIITQTVDIPASRKLTIDVPPGVPEGQVIISFTPTEARPRKPRKFGCLKGQIWMADDFDAPMALVDAALVDEILSQKK